MKTSVYMSDNKRHLICYPYTIAALHHMAQDLGIKRCWYHASPCPHYDIPKRRQAEIASKTMVISARELLNNCRQWQRQQG